MPVEAGIQVKAWGWTPVFTGVTIIHHSRVRGNDKMAGYASSPSSLFNDDNPRNSFAVLMFGPATTS